MHDEANNGFSQFCNDPKNINTYNERAKYPYMDSRIQGLGPRINALVELKRTYKPYADRSLLLRGVAPIGC